MLSRENEESKVIKQFARFAYQYDSYNVIQVEVARELVEKLSLTKYKTILDMGCGSGAVYKNIKKRNISVDNFIALDSATEMLELHPNDAIIEKVTADFNNIQTYKNLNVQHKDTLLLSSSALQWSKDLEFVLEQLSKKADKAYFSIFTANTFKTLHKTANIESPIFTMDFLKKVIEKYYHANFERKEYRLEFESTRDMFNYIKKSGVSGGEKQLTYRQTKELMINYPLKYLEFEVLFVEGISLTR